MARKRMGATEKRSVDWLQTDEIVKGIKKDEEQDKKLKELEQKLEEETGYKNFEDYLKNLTEKVNKITSDVNKEVNALYSDIYNLKQKDIKTDSNNDIQQISIDEIKDKALKNKNINDKQEEDIKGLKRNIDSLFDFTELVNSRFTKFKKFIIALGIISVVSLLANIGIIIFLCV